MRLIPCRSGFMRGPYLLFDVSVNTAKKTLLPRFRLSLAFLLAHSLRLLTENGMSIGSVR